MKVYITPKSQLISKRMALFVFAPILLLLSVSILVSPQPSSGIGNLGAAMLPFVFGILLFYGTMQPNVLLIEDDKIILRSALRSIIYNASEFKGIGPLRWKARYAIHFSDGKCFEFNTRYEGWYYRYKYPQQERISRLTQQINRAIKINAKSQVLYQ